MNKKEMGLEVRNLTEVEIRKLVKEQSIAHLQYEGYLHKLYEQQHGECGAYEWIRNVVDTSCVEDLPLKKLMEKEKQLREKVVRGHIEESDYRNKMVESLAYKGRLYNLYITNGGTSLLLVQWFNLIGLYTYGYSEMNWDYYMTEEIEKFHLNAIRIILKMNIKIEVDKYEQQIVTNKMVDDKLITVALEDVQDANVYYTYVSSIGVEEVRIAHSCCVA